MNYRSPPVAQKDEDDQDDQQDRGTNGKDNVADGFADGVGSIEGDFVLHAGRKALGKAIEFGDAARCTSRALAVESWVTAMPTASRPL